MIIDTLFVILIAIAIFKGFTKGLVVGLFSFVAYFIGLAAALKLSASVAQYLAGKDTEPSAWMPFVAFFLVFIAIVLVVNIVARLIKSVLKAAMMGWIDRLGGVVFFVLIYLFIFSIFLFYISEMNWISDSTKESSRVYTYIEPVAPFMVELLGKILPVFKDLFEDLKMFFGGLAPEQAGILKS